MRTPDRDRDEDEDDFEDENRDSLTDVPGGVRLQKVLAEAGVGSRRHCEELLGAGGGEVDGETVRRFGARVDPEHQVIRVDGKRIPAKPGLVYLALNKPAGVLTAMSDPRGRKTISDFLGDRTERLFHIGRLDYETEGLMLLTNDGELAHRLAPPSFEVAKTYLAEVTGPVPKDLGRRLAPRVELDAGGAPAGWGVAMPCRAGVRGPVPKVRGRRLATGVELDDGVATADRFRIVE